MLNRSKIVIIKQVYWGTITSFHNGFPSSKWRWIKSVVLLRCWWIYSEQWLLLHNVWPWIQSEERHHCVFSSICSVWRQQSIKHVLSWSHDSSERRGSSGNTHSRQETCQLSQVNHSERAARTLRVNYSSADTLTCFYFRKQHKSKCLAPHRNLQRRGLSWMSAVHTEKTFQTDYIELCTSQFF